jgi:hypothetical protein
MTPALATLNRYRSTLVIDALLLIGLYLVPAISHLTALPLYKFEPMRVALVIALLFTNRANTYLIALTIPLASAVLTGHPEPVKAVLIGIELMVLVASYSYIASIPRVGAFLALTAAILLGKLVYYSLKFAALSGGLLAGNLMSTPVPNQLIMAVGTAAAFALVVRYQSSKNEN